MIENPTALATTATDVYRFSSLRSFAWSYLNAAQCSFAVVFSELLTRQEPFPKMSDAVVVFQIMSSNARPQLPADICEPLKKLVDQCWDRSAAARPSFSAVKASLTALNLFAAYDGMVPLFVCSVFCFRLLKYRH